jgi:putative salt-induced outer membrane protein YdiY
MNREPGNLSRSVAPAALLAIALLHVLPRSAGAEEPPVEEAKAEAEATAESAEAASASAGADEAEAAAPTAQETVEGLIAAPGGVPAEPAEPKSAVDTVKAAMAAVEKQSIEGVSETYVIEFGDTFDWVQMVSGEWVKGNIDRMRDDTLEFDSDKLDMLYLDFADVALVHSPQVNTYVFDDRVSATGRAVITAEQVIVETKDEGTKVFPRSELESIVEGERERDWWSMKLRFGLTLNRGNTDQLTYDIKFNTKREDRMTLLDLNYNGTFGRTDGVQNVQRHLGEFLFNVFLGSRWWVTPAFGQLFNDRFQNIRFRATPAAGAGVHIIDKPNVAWDFQTGIGYQYLRYDDISMTPDTENPQHDAFIPLYTYWDFDITGDIDLTLSWLTNLVVTSIGNTNHTGKADLSIELTSAIDLDIAFLFLRTEDPAPPADPTDPPIEKNDYQLVVGVSLELG